MYDREGSSWQSASVAVAIQRKDQRRLSHLLKSSAILGLSEDLKHSRKVSSMTQISEIVSFVSQILRRTKKILDGPCEIFSY